MSCFLRAKREALGLSQQALADKLGVSRQSLGAIEAEKQIPSTTLALRLARALGCEVEALFTLSGAGELDVELRSQANLPSPSLSGRLTIARIEDRFVAHPLSDHAPLAADGLLPSAPSENLSRVTAQSLAPLADLESHVLVAGCAPLLGLLSQYAERRVKAGRVTWLSENTESALSLLELGQVHVAGMHFVQPNQNRLHARLKQALPGRTLQVVNMTRFRQGIVTAPGNPLALSSLEDLRRKGLRLALREAGSSAARLLEQGKLPACHRERALSATSHDQVAQLVAWGAVDAGIALESVALSRGLAFVPLSEERFDLVVRKEPAFEAAASRIFNLLSESWFRKEASRLPGYDDSLSGASHILPAA